MIFFALFSPESRMNAADFLKSVERFIFTSVPDITVEKLVFQEIQIINPLDKIECKTMVLSFEWKAIPVMSKRLLIWIKNTEIERVSELFPKY